MKKRVFYILLATQSAISRNSIDINTYDPYERSSPEQPIKEDATEDTTNPTPQHPSIAITTHQTTGNATLNPDTATTQISKGLPESTSLQKPTNSPIIEEPNNTPKETADPFKAPSETDTSQEQQIAKSLGIDHTTYTQEDLEKLSLEKLLTVLNSDPKNSTFISYKKQNQVRIFRQIIDTLSGKDVTEKEKNTILLYLSDGTAESHSFLTSFFSSLINYPEKNEELKNNLKGIIEDSSILSEEITPKLLDGLFEKPQEASDISDINVQDLIKQHTDDAELTDYNAVLKNIFSVMNKKKINYSKEDLNTLASELLRDTDGDLVDNDQLRDLKIALQNKIKTEQYSSKVSYLKQIKDYIDAYESLMRISQRKFTKNHLPDFTSQDITDYATIKTQFPDLFAMLKEASELPDEGSFKTLEYNLEFLAQSIKTKESTKNQTKQTPLSSSKNSLELPSNINVQDFIKKHTDSNTDLIDYDAVLKNIFDTITINKIAYSPNTIDALASKLLYNSDGDLIDQDELEDLQNALQNKINTEQRKASSLTRKETINTIKRMQQYIDAYDDLINISKRKFTKNNLSDFTSQNITDYVTIKNQFPDLFTILKNANELPDEGSFDTLEDNLEFLAQSIGATTKNGQNDDDDGDWV